jgi:seryl-tRNA synthetase
LKNEAALLELALINWSMHKLITKGFTPILPPDLIRREIAEGCGFQPRGESSQIYSIADHNLCLAGTAEIPLAGLYVNKTIPVEKLPIKLAGFSHSFRLEAGSRGTESKGLYRVVRASTLLCCSLRCSAPV